MTEFPEREADVLGMFALWSNLDMVKSTCPYAAQKKLLVCSKVLVSDAESTVGRAVTRRHGATGGHGLGVPAGNTALVRV